MASGKMIQTISQDAPVPVNKIAGKRNRITSQSLRLVLRPHAFINQLLHFDHPRLIVHAKGISLCLETEFSVFVRKHNPVLPIYSDRISGLTIDSSEVSGIFVYQSKKGQISFEMEFVRDGFAIAIHPSRSENSQTVTEQIVRSFCAGKTPTAILREKGAGAWLDDWTHVNGKGSLCKNRRGNFVAKLCGSGFSIETEGITGFQDQDHGTRKFVSTDGQITVVAHTSIIRPL